MTESKKTIELMTIEELEEEYEQLMPISEQLVREQLRRFNISEELLKKYKLLIKT